MWTPHLTECELASYVAVGLQTVAGGQRDDSQRAATRVLPEIIRSAMRAVGPDVATPAMTDGRWAATVLRCAALIEPTRVADSEEGRRLAVQLLNACVDVASTLQETPCTTCFRFALGWHAVPATDPVSTTSRESASALYGLHVQTAHPNVPAPNPDYECADCLHFVSYVERSGDDVEVLVGLAPTSTTPGPHQPLQTTRTQPLTWPAVTASTVAVLKHDTAAT
ncbi:hypothetical protein [Streptomyces sp. NPDC051218]|uniref:hypothetical protein n=1 Tax=Streptomyces sp. NPDC051218 TaxID=3365645 RepID=UPI0037AD06F8